MRLPSLGKFGVALTMGAARRAAPVEALAESVDLIEPDELQDCPPVLHDPADQALLRSGTPGIADVHAVFQLAQTRVIHHLPLKRFVVRNAAVLPFGVFAQAGFLRRGATFGMLGEIRMRHWSTALYCMSQMSTIFFGHWLQDACPSALLQCDEDGLLLDRRAAWPHVLNYLTAFELPAALETVHFVDKLVMYDDRGEGPNKRQRYAELRKRLESWTGLPRCARDLVYLRRGSTGVARLLVNEAELLRALPEARVVDISTLDLQALYEQLRQAKVIVSLDGSHLNHVFFCAPQACTLLTLSPNDGFNLNHFGYSNAVGMRYGFTVVEREGASYRVRVPALLRLIDRASAIG